MRRGALPPAAGGEAVEHALEPIAEALLAPALDDMRKDRDQVRVGAAGGEPDERSVPLTRPDSRARDLDRRRAEDECVHGIHRTHRLRVREAGPSKDAVGAVDDG